MKIICLFLVFISFLFAKEEIEINSLNDNQLLKILESEKLIQPILKEDLNSSLDLQPAILNSSDIDSTLVPSPANKNELIDKDFVPNSKFESINIYLISLHKNKDLYIIFSDYFSIKYCSKDFIPLLTIDDTLNFHNSDLFNFFIHNYTLNKNMYINILNNYSFLNCNSPDKHFIF